jgi:hypothetical protein
MTPLAPKGGVALPFPAVKRYRPVRRGSAHRSNPHGMFWEGDRRCARARTLLDTLRITALSLTRRSATRRWPGRVLCYDSTRGMNQFSGAYFVNIDGVLPDKLKAISIHASQAHHHYMDERAVIAEAENWGRRLGDNGVYEAFEVRLFVE